MKLDAGATTTIVTFIVGGGLAALVTQVIRGWSTLRTGARTTTREVIKDLAAARDESEDREAGQRRDKDYWRGVAADYGFQLRAAGMTPVPEHPMSPSERRREQLDARRHRRAQRAPSTWEIEQATDGDELM